MAAQLGRRCVCCRADLAPSAPDQPRRTDATQLWIRYDAWLTEGCHSCGVWWSRIRLIGRCDVHRSILWKLVRLCGDLVRTRFSLAPGGLQRPVSPSGDLHTLGRTDHSTQTALHADPGGRAGLSVSA